MKVRSDLQRGIHVAPGASISVEEAGQFWFERAKRDRLALSTVRQYEDHLEHHILPELGRVKLSELTTPRDHEFFDGLLSSRSRALTRKVLTSLGSLIDEANPARRRQPKPCPPRKDSPAQERGRRWRCTRNAIEGLWIEQDLQPKRIQQLAGHSSIRVTFDVYGHLFKSEAERSDCNERDRSATTALMRHGCNTFGPIL